MEPGPAPTHYDRLGVSPQAPPEVVRAAYRALAKLHHPDGPTPNEEQMTQVNLAWEVLRIPDGRAAYDAELARRTASASARPTGPTRSTPPPTSSAEPPPPPPSSSPWSGPAHDDTGNADSAWGEPTLGHTGWGETIRGDEGWGEADDYPHAQPGNGRREAVDGSPWGSGSGWGETVDDDPWVPADTGWGERADEPWADHWDPHAPDPTAILGRRFGAFVVDVVAVALPDAALIGYGSPSAGTIMLVAIALFLAIHVVLQGLTGNTPGKALFRVRTVRQSGQAPGLGRALVRSLLWVVDSFPWFAPLVGHYTARHSAGHRRVGDLAARTFVVRQEDAGYPLVTVVPAEHPSFDPNVRSGGGAGRW